MYINQTNTEHTLENITLSKEDNHVTFKWYTKYFNVDGLGMLIFSSSDQTMYVHLLYGYDVPDIYLNGFKWECHIIVTVVVWCGFANSG